MQPISLTLENFGPYKQTEIDFSNFYAQSLFLITGKTGSGKTTIFDGMSYALYNSTSGGLREGREMRSNFAQVGEPTKVTFIFKQDNVTYKIEREPEQIVKKLRGEGFREQSAEVKLTVFDEQQKEVNQLIKQREVGEFLSELLKLNQQQFSQIVMLPQGEFRRFLGADSDSKEKVLRKLFNTYFYQDVANYLKEKKKEQDTYRKEINQQIKNIVDQIKWEDTFKSQLQKEMTYQEVLTLYEEQEKENTTKQATIQKELDVLKLKQTKLVDQLVEKEKVLELFKQLETYQDEQKQLNQQSEEMTLLKEKVALLKEINGIQPTVNHIHTMKQELKNLEDSIKELKSKEDSLKETITQTKQALEILNQQSEEIVTKKNQVAEIERSMPNFEKKQVLEQQIESNQQELTMKKNSHEQLVSEQQIIEKSLVTINELVAKKSIYLEEKMTLASLKQELVLQGEVILNYEKLNTQIKNEQYELQTEQENLLVLTTQLEQLEKTKNELKSEWAKAQIAKLSLLLVDGEPCAVCGATTHPNPSHGEFMTEKEIGELENQLEKSELAEKVTTEKITLLKSQIEFKIEQQEASISELNLLKEQLEKWFDTVDKLHLHQEKEQQIKNKIIEIENQLQLIEREQHRVSDLKEKVQIIQHRIKEEENVLRLLENDNLQITATLNELMRNLPQKWNSLVEMTNEKKTLEQEIKVWEDKTTQLKDRETSLDKELLETLTNLKNNNKQIEDLGSRLSQEDEKISDFLEGRSLEEEQLNILLLELTQLEQLLQRIVDFEKKEYALKENITTVSKKIINQEKPDLSYLIEEKEITDKLLDEKYNEKEKLLFVITHNKEIVSTIKKQEKNMGDALKALEEITTLSDVMTGDGPHKLSIERFVLQTYLKKILQRANEKLIGLTNGRYQFELKEEQGSFKKKTGLEINIFDDNVGMIRSVNTLSGGESFIASLSLALSLAEIIQEEAGGIKINAMFVDEGFGSLDEDSLEMAIRALESIEGEGRIIGIISHVSELKERIPQQLQVISKNGQSDVKVRLEFE